MQPLSRGRQSFCHQWLLPVVVVEDYIFVPYQPIASRGPDFFARLHASRSRELQLLGVFALERIEQRGDFEGHARPVVVLFRLRSLLAFSAADLSWVQVVVDPMTFSS